MSRFFGAKNIFFVKETKDCFFHPLNKIKWGPDESSASDFAFNSLLLSIAIVHCDSNRLPGIVSMACSMCMWTHIFKTHISKLQYHIKNVIDVLHIGYFIKNLKKSILYRVIFFTGHLKKIRVWKKVRYGTGHLIKYLAQWQNELSHIFFFM